MVLLVGEVVLATEEDHLVLEQRAPDPGDGALVEIPASFTPSIRAPMRLPSFVTVMEAVVETVIGVSFVLVETGVVR